MDKTPTIFNQLYGKKCWRAWRGYSVLEKVKIANDLAETQILFSNNLIIKTNHKKPENKWYLSTPNKFLSVKQNCIIEIEDKK
jgi:hypothetical protein